MGARPKSEDANNYMNKNPYGKTVYENRDGRFALPNKFSSETLAKIKAIKKEVKGTVN